MGAEKRWEGQGAIQRSPLPWGSSPTSIMRPFHGPSRRVGEGFTRECQSQLCCVLPAALTVLRLSIPICEMGMGIMSSSQLVMKTT